MHNQIISFFLLQIAGEGFGHILKYIDNYFRNIYVQLVQVPLCREKKQKKKGYCAILSYAKMATMVLAAQEYKSLQPI